MSYADRLTAEINSLLDELAEKDKEWRATWVAHQICKKHNRGLGKGEHADFWRHCGYSDCRREVTRCINRRAGDRRRKAEAIIQTLWGTLSATQRTDPETVRIFRECENQRIRDLIAREAGRLSPSDETWTLAAGILAQRVRDARWGAGLTERAS